MQLFDESPGWSGQISNITCGNFPTSSCHLRRFVSPAPTSKTKKFLNKTCRVHGKLQLLCSKFFRAAIESTRKQPQTCAQKLFDKMLPYAWQEMHMLSHILATSNCHL